MEKTKNDLIEDSMPGVSKSDRTWMIDFWEVFTDCVIELDVNFLVQSILKKADTTFVMDVLGKSFFDIAFEKDREHVESELKKLREPGVPYKRLTFLARQGRYFRWTLAAVRQGDKTVGFHGVGIDVTEQSLNEITLSWQKAIIEGSSDFISIADAEGKVLYTNPGAYKMAGYRRGSDILLPEQLYTPEYLDTIEKIGMPQVMTEGNWTGLGEIRRADSQIVPIEHNIYRVRNNLDDAVLYATMSRDITDFIEHEKVMQNEQRRASLLASVAMSFSLSEDFDMAIEAAMAEIGQYMSLDSMFIYSIDHEKKTFRRDYLWATHEVYGLYPANEFPYVNEKSGEETREYSILQQDSMFVVDDMSILDKDLFVNIRGAGIKSMICVPIHVSDQFWGYIGLNLFTGKRKWADADIQFLKTICGILSNSLEKRVISQRWLAAQADLQAVVGNYPGIIWSLNSKRCFTLYDGVLFNPYEGNLTSIVGQSMYDFSIANPGVLHPSILEKAELTFTGIPQDWVMETKDGIFRCNTMPILDSLGDIVGVVGASVDVTSMIRLQKELEDAREAAEAANKAKSEFLSRMSHEIRTPLNAIVGMAQIAKGYLEGEDKANHSIDEILNASKHLMGLINDILDFSKIESGKMELINEDFSFLDAMNEVISLIEPRCKDNDIVFKANIHEIAPFAVVGDKLRLKQVLINLLGNAVKFTKRNGKVCLDLQIVNENEQSVALKLTIKDNGIGISEEQQSKLFQAFEQGKSSAALKFEGTGLGLAISQRLVKNMGGLITVESSLGVGSTFSFTLDFPKAALSQADNLQGIHKENHDLSGKHVLLAEDIAINRLILIELLKDTNLVIEEAVDGKQALAMFEQSPLNYYDLIFMDIQMPYLDGYQATEAIRLLERSDAESVPIIAMTANAFREDVEKALNVGMNGHLSKPIDIEVVRRLLYDTLSDN